MRLILLPGLDGTGKLFEPLLQALPSDIKTQTIHYPTDIEKSYSELIDYILEQLPKEEAFTLLGESFSGYIAYAIALHKPKNLSGLIFVATFIENPRPNLSKLLPLIPMRFLLSRPIPTFILKMMLLKGNTGLQTLFHETLLSVSTNVLYKRIIEIISLSQATESVEIKSLYIQATQDRIVPSSCYDTFEKNFSNIRRQKVKGLHLILQENPTECSQIIYSFYTSINT